MFVLQLERAWRPGAGTGAAAATHSQDSKSSGRGMGQQPQAQTRHVGLPDAWRGAQHTEALQGPAQTGRRLATGGPYTAQSSGHRSQGTEPSGFTVQWGGSYNTSKARDFCVHMEDVKCTSQKILTCSWSGPGFSTAAWSTSQGARVKEAWHSAAQCQGPQACHQAGPRSDRPKEYTRHFPQH